MRHRIRAKSWSLKLLPFICIVFLMYLIMTPSISMQLGRMLFGNSKIGLDKYYQIPFKQNESTYFISEFNGTEILIDSESKATLTRSLQFYKNKILRDFYDMLPVAGISLGVIICYYGYFIRKKRKQFSVPAILIGGHAPPKIN